jgi:hypothetical protein
MKAPTQKQKLIGTPPAPPRNSRWLCSFIGADVWRLIATPWAIVHKRKREAPQ